jgi:hypothetical protein
LFDSSWRIFSPGFFWELSSDWLCASCQHPSRLSISHELAYSWNIPFKYMWSSTFMELPSRPDMHLILCSKRLIVISSKFFTMDSSQLVKSDREKKCIGIINGVHHPYSCGEVCIWASKTDGPTVSLGGVHPSSIHSNATMR